MKWLDDAKDKAQEAADDAKRKATEEAGKAAVNATIGAVKRGVEGLADSILSAAEARLEQQEEAMAASPSLPATEATPPDLVELNAEEAARAELDRLQQTTARIQAESQSSQPKPPTTANERPPSPGAEPVPPRRLDPLASAQQALERAARARGVAHEPFSPDARPDPHDPFAAARAALERSRSAREDATVSRGTRAREAHAREELARLKATGWTATPPDAQASVDEDEPPSPVLPKKRRL